jgi:hypothetical protein
MKRHIEIHHTQLYSILRAKKLKDGPLVTPACKPRPIVKQSRKDVVLTKQLQAIVQWIIETDQPLTVVQSEAFRRMPSVFF